MISNARAYFLIAGSAEAEAIRLYEAARRPNPACDTGSVMRFDPDQRSFECSLISIVFSCMFLEAVFYIEGIDRFGRILYDANHDKKEYEYKLGLFGLGDDETLREGKRLRLLRKSLVHEKAVEELPVDRAETYVAQVEATWALCFVGRVVARLEQRTGHS